MKKNKNMVAIYDFNLRNLIKIVNELGIQKNDIVSLVKDHESYVLIYYKANE